MRITFVLSSLTLSGGVMLVIEYADRLAQRGHQIALVVPKGAVDGDALGMLDARVQVIEASAALPEQRSLRAFARLTLALARAVPHADVLIATHTPTVAPTLLANLGQRTARRGWLFMDYPEMFRQRPVERLLLRWAPRWFPLILPISQPLAEAVRPHTQGRIAVITPGLPRSDMFFKGSATEREGDGIRILYVGDDRPRKGLADFLEAVDLVAQRLPALRPVIVSKRVCTVHSKLPVEFYLHPSHRELADLYRSSSLYVSASWGEGLGYPPLEAMACGTPVVLTDSAGVRDYAQDGVNCLMAPPQDPAALAKAILYLLEHPEFAAQLAANGLQTASRYDWNEAVVQLEQHLSGDD